MTAAGFPTDPERRDGSERGGSGEPPAEDWNAQFTAIVSGISGSMRWAATADDLDAHAAEADRAPVEQAPPVFEGPWFGESDDTAESRRLRREMRRQERADALAAHLQAQAEFEAEMAADDEHFVPPPPPPLPRLRRRTVAALLLIALGILLLAWPALLPVSYDVIMVLALLLILGGATVLVIGMRRYRGAPGEGWDDGAEV